MTLHKGISLYPGLGMPLDEMLERLEIAAGMGMDRLFLSFHIPETDPAAFERQVTLLLERARELGLATVGDLVPGKPVPETLSCLRLDDGFTPQAVAALQQDYPDRTLVLNASTLREEELEAMERSGVELHRVEALHNFYPHPHTGLSERYFAAQNRLLHRYGILTGAFIPSRYGRRGPVGAGLPTLEGDRDRKAPLAAQHLLLLGADQVCFGDDGPSGEELQQVARVERDVVSLTLLVPHQRDALYDELERHVYETRRDEAEEVIRTANSRSLWKNKEIPPLYMGRCQEGTVTLDNSRYGRYSGELEICKQDLPADKRVDVLGKIPAEELFLLPYLQDGRKFRFHIVAQA